MSTDLFIDTKSLMGELANDLMDGALWGRPTIVPALEKADETSFDKASRGPWTIRTYGLSSVVLSSVVGPQQGPDLEADGETGSPEMAVWRDFQPQILRHIQDRISRNTQSSDSSAASVTCRSQILTPFDHRAGRSIDLPKTRPSAMCKDVSGGACTDWTLVRLRA